jgi:hypothetical protein
MREMGLRPRAPSAGVNGIGSSNVPHGDIERDLLLALEKCDQMLSRLRTQPPPSSEPAEQDLESVGGEGVARPDAPPKTDKIERRLDADFGAPINPNRKALPTRRGL